jgi:hypothetical protein
MFLPHATPVESPLAATPAKWTFLVYKEARHPISREMREEAGEVSKGR